MKVKVCGLTRQEDVHLATSLGADFLGFIFYPKSPRFCEPERVQKILASLDLSSLKVIPVGVFVDSSSEDIMEICCKTGIRYVQLHGDEDSELIKNLTDHGIEVMKVLRPREEEDFKVMLDHPCSVFLIDTWHPTLKGGTGKTIPWELLKSPLLQKKDVFVAGGLNPTNISDFLQRHRPFGIDVSSGLEKKPGEKDPEKMKLFFKILEKYK